MDKRSRGGEKIMTKMKHKNKGFKLGSMLIAGLVVVGVLMYAVDKDTGLVSFAAKNRSTPKGLRAPKSKPVSPYTAPAAPSSPRGCAQDSQLCPDGSYVSRKGPNCEFTACPVVRDTPCARKGVGAVDWLGTVVSRGDNTVVVDVGDGTLRTAYNCSWTDISGRMEAFPQSAVFSLIQPGDQIAISASALNPDNKGNFKSIIQANAVKIVDNSMVMKQFEDVTVVMVKPEALTISVKGDKKQLYTVQLVSGVTKCYKKSLKDGAVGNPTEINCLTDIQAGHVLGQINGSYREGTRTVVDTTNILDKSL